MSLVERALSCKTLVCLVQALESKKTTVELRNETSVHGTIDLVDGYMNVHMSNVKFTSATGETRLFDNFFVQGRQIRFVQIPDDVNIAEAIERRLATIQRVRSWREPQRQKIAQVRRRDRETMSTLSVLYDSRRSSSSTTRSTPERKEQN